MPRTPFKPADIHAEPGPLPESHALTLAEEQQAKDIENEMAFEAAKVVGRVETALFYETVSQKVIVESYLELKKNKAFMAVTYRDADGNVKRISDLAEFCERVFKKSYRRVQQLVENYHVIGSDLFETAEQIGFRQKDYTALKALPADDQEAIKQAMQADDRDQVLDLLQEMAARHASEKAALTAQAKEAEETAEARDQVVRKKESKITELEQENFKLKRRVETATPDEVGAQLREEVGQFAFGAEAQILGNLRAGFQALADHADAHGVTHENFMAGCLAQIEGALITVRAEFGVKAKPDADPVPDWVKDDRPVEEIVGDAAGDLSDFERRHGYNPLSAARG